MNHRAFTIFVLVFSCVAAIGFINAKAADEQLETPISRGLPKGKVELLKLSIGELGLAVRRLEESARIDIPKLCSCPRPEPTGAEETKLIKDQTQAIRTHLNKAEDTARRMGELQKSLRDNAAELRRHKKCIKAFGGFAAWQNKINEMIQREDDGRGDSILKTKLRKEIAKEEKEIHKKKKESAKKREKCRKDLTQATGRMADTKRKIREEKEALGKMLRTYRKKYGHSLSLGQHALALHLYPSYDSIVNTLGVTTLRSALQSATSRGDMKEVKRLLKMGADVHQKAGEYSALALANILGHADIVEILAPSYADVQTPWDTHKRQDTQSLLHMVENQLKRVSDLFAIVKASDKGAKDLNYCEKWLNHLKCKVSCIKKHSTGSTAQTR